MGSTQPQPLGYQGSNGVGDQDILLAIARLLK